MEELIRDIINSLRRAPAEGRDEDALRAADDKLLAVLIRRHNRGRSSGEPHFAKKQLLPYYRQVKREDPALWRSWNIDEELDRRLMRLFQLKPRRTASGVATVTVLTKPWPCANTCIYCPNDLRMPKSYLADEPACQRAEHCYFDPYLQVSARLRTLERMGHVIDKVELIVLGGTWSDYPEGYRLWFTTELFRALNDFVPVDDSDDAGNSKSAGSSEVPCSGETPCSPETPCATEAPCSAETMHPTETSHLSLPTDPRHDTVEQRSSRYEAVGISNDPEVLRAQTAAAQSAVERGELSYNAAMKELYGAGSAWDQVAKWQVAELADVQAQHLINETVACRSVGFTIETRPDAITPQGLRLIRQLGCTKVQIGIQSLDPDILKANRRQSGVEDVQRAFALLHLFGFKIHVHFMANLYGSSPEADKRDYLRLISDGAYLPDEVKLYPCALVAGTELVAHYQDGSWRPYTEEELIDLLLTDAQTTPQYIRISRMIRDISAHDIMVGNRKVNLRQMVEEKATQSGISLPDIRSREIGNRSTPAEELQLEELPYRTTVSDEVFLQWVSPAGHIAGFLRLSLPQTEALAQLGEEAPLAPQEAMIREVHIYGRAVRIHRSDTGVQHHGLGRRLIERACEIARERGYTRIAVISAIGTRTYYRSLGFADAGLYQRKELL